MTGPRLQRGGSNSNTELQGTDEQRTSATSRPTRATPDGRRCDRERTLVSADVTPAGQIATARLHGIFPPRAPLARFARNFVLSDAYEGTKALQAQLQRGLESVRFDGRLLREKSSRA